MHQTIEQGCPFEDISQVKLLFPVKVCRKTFIQSFQALEIIKKDFLKDLICHNLTIGYELINTKSFASWRVNKCPHITLVLLLYKRRSLT